MRKGPRKAGERFWTGLNCFNLSAADSTSEQLIQLSQGLIQPSERLIQPSEGLSQPSERLNLPVIRAAATYKSTPLFTTGTKQDRCERMARKDA